MEKFSAIKQTYYGNCGVIERVKLTTEEREIANEISVLEKFIIEKIKGDAELTKAYMKIDDKLTELSCIENERSYIEGFRFGFLMALDVLNYHNEE